MTSKSKQTDKEYEYGYWLDCDYMSGACFAYENGKKHLFYGNIAGTQQDYGIAVSHLVLSVEEMIKSLLLLCSYVYNDLLTTEEKRKIFIRHDYKHSNVKEFLFALSEKNISYYHENPFDREITNKFQIIAHFLSRGLKLESLQERDIKQLIDLVNKANDFKNKGFYVDYQNNWITPDSITQKIFVKYHALSKRLLNYIEPIFTIPIIDERFQKFIEGNWV